MKLSQWPKQKGIHYNTALKWFKQGKIQNAYQMDTGTILIDNNDNFKAPSNRVYIYCRVSNHSRRKELDYQVNRCEEFCRSRGYEVLKVFKEVASGMNDNRKELNKLFDLRPQKIIIEHKDRLTRFGFNYLEKLLSKQGCEIVVLNRDKEDETDLMKDMISIITSFCCRLYGLRRAKNKVDRIKKELQND